MPREDARWTDNIQSVVYTSNGVPIVDTRLTPEENRRRRRVAKAWEAMDLAELRKLGVLPKEEGPTSDE